jgi:hypothetical protein
VLHCLPALLRLVLLRAWLSSPFLHCFLLHRKLLLMLYFTAACTAVVTPDCAAFFISAQEGRPLLCIAVGKRGMVPMRALLCWTPVLAAASAGKVSRYCVSKVWTIERMYDTAIERM